MAGSAPSNNQAVDFEKQQAAEADAKEAARQARLTQGQTLIDQIFNGSPVMGTKSQGFDWSSFSPANPAAAAWAAQNNMAAPTASGVPEGYTAIQVPKPATAGAAATADPYARTRAVADLNAKTNAVNSQVIQPTAQSGGGGAGGGMTWALKDAQGNLHYQGDPFDVTTTYDTGKKTGGFGDDFYNNYNQKILDYYQPDEQRQYNEAQRDLKYHLADAGMLQSSVAADKQGELGYQDALQKANIVANANTQTGNLKNQIQANKESLINQLYATEDPTLTANLAQSSANATQLQSPNLTPAAALFTPALSAVGSAINAYTSPYSNYAAPGSQSPAPASSLGTGSGQLKNSGGPPYG